MTVTLPEYCDNCPYIDVVSDTMFADDEPVVIQIQCRNHAICERMAEYMKSQGATTDEPQDDTGETGYNPYMGCYDFDC